VFAVPDALGFGTGRGEHTGTLKFYSDRARLKSNPLENFAKFCNNTDGYSITFTHYLPIQLVANMDSFIAFSTELTKLRCFYSNLAVLSSKCSKCLSPVFTYSVNLFLKFKTTSFKKGLCHVDISDILVLKLISVLVFIFFSSQNFYFI